MKTKQTKNYETIENFQGISSISYFFFCFVFSLLLSGRVYSQTSIRLAIIDLAGDDRGEITALFRNSASPSFELINQDLTRAAARGAGYAGSLNMSRSEASALGRSIGCDFYILGKVQVARRSVSIEQFYFDALAGVFLVETRTGRLIRFFFERIEAESETRAYAGLKETIKSRWEQYADAMLSARANHEREIENIGQSNSPTFVLLNDETQAGGIEPPVFYQRLKPEYTQQADLAGITATVELEATFGEDGNVGPVEVIRWAGFGLDESAISTVRQLKFQPASISQGAEVKKRLTIRGIVRYNFRRPLTQAGKPQAQSQEEIERLKRSLRNIMRSGQMPGRNPDF
jgi:TonB family protein